jgi:gluconolactonase
VIFVDGLSVPEGPVACADGSWLVVEMGPDRGCVTRVSDGRRAPLARTGRPNGLAVDRAGTIWVAESQPSALLRMTASGEYQRVLEDCIGDPFLFPNDLCFGPDGMLYLTDSGITFQDWAPGGGSVREDYASAPMDGRLYRIDPRSLEVVELARGYRFTNGLAFGPGDRHLYVAETITGRIWRYPWSPEGIGRGEIFADVIDPDAPPGIKGPDGMAFGANGDLYVAVFGQGDVTVLRPDGTVRHRIPTQGDKPTNVAFGHAGEKRIYVTEDQHGLLETFDVDTEGLPLHS